MKLTDDMLKHPTKSTRLLQKGYVLKDKTIFLSEADTISYINNLKRAKEGRINIPTIYDYRINSVLSSVTNLSLIEEEMPGESIERYLYLPCNPAKDDMASCSRTYLENIRRYEEELQRRALAPQKMYDKYFLDYKGLEAYHLRPNDEHIFFLFDETRGFSIIKPLPNNDSESYTNDLYFFDKYISTIIGFILPKMIIDTKSVTLIPKEDTILIKKYLHKITEKIVITLKSKGYSNHIINEVVSEINLRFRDYLKEDNPTREEVLDYLTQKYGIEIEKKKGGRR